MKIWKQGGSVSYLRMLMMTSYFIGSCYFLQLNLFAEKNVDKEYIIGTEDVIEIRVWDHEDLYSVVEISPEGKFNFPFIGSVHADGLSVLRLENLLEKELADGYLISPQVTISVKEYKNQKVSLLGEVNKPGIYSLKGNTHILELISQAGGFTDNAGQTITIVRPKSPAKNRKLPVPGESKESESITLVLSEFEANSTFKNFSVVSGDTIYVNAASRIFVTGEVKNPGALKWERELTVRQAVSLAGGPTESASPKRIIVVRMKNGVEMKFKAKMEEFVLPGDIIKVPERYF